MLLKLSDEIEKFLERRDSKIRKDFEQWIVR